MKPHHYLVATRNAYLVGFRSFMDAVHWCEQASPQSYDIVGATEDETDRWTIVGVDVRRFR